MPCHRGKDDMDVLQASKLVSNTPTTIGRTAGA